MAENKEQKEQNTLRFFIVIGIVLLIAMAIFVYVKKILPDHLMNQGKKYLEVGNADKAYSMFKLVEKSRPYDEDPVYYQAMALSKMPPTYETQKALYDIAQLDNCDDASKLAEQTINEMRISFENKIGPNYVDNVLYENQLIRWNKSRPVKYYISNNIDASDAYISLVKKAFDKWQAAGNGAITFREIHSNNEADIVVNFVNEISTKEGYEPLRAGLAIPTIKDSTLVKVDIKIKPVDMYGNYHNQASVYNVIMHNIGHAIGLWGHSFEKNDIMALDSDYISPKREGQEEKPLSARDINTLNLVYMMVPDVINIPLTASEYQNLIYHYVITDYPGESFEYEIERLIELLQNDRQNIVNLVDLAINYSYKRQYERSNYILRKALDLTNNDLNNQFVVLYNMAANYYKLRDYKEAEKFLNYATNLNVDLETDILEAFIDFKLGRTPLAKQKLVDLRRDNPAHVEISLKLASIYYKEKDRKKEMEVIDKLIERNADALRDRRVQKYKTKN